MKRICNLSLFSSLLLGSLLSLTNSCDTTVSPKLLPVLTTTQIDSITSTTAKTGGNITSEGSSNVKVRGLCWSLKPNPTIIENKTSDGTGPGLFSNTITHLLSDTTYYIRAYASNNDGTSYGNTIVFKTLPSLLAVLTTNIPTDITETTATCGGNITFDGNSPILAKGICWDTIANPTIDKNKTIDGAGAGMFSTNITKLNKGTIYYVRAYATNVAGNSYGNQITINTLSTPKINTIDASSISTTFALSGGNITYNGGSAITERGVCWNTSDNPTITNSKTIVSSSSSGNFITNITELEPNTTYFYRAYATNNLGTGYGNVLKFTTQQLSSLTVIDNDGNIYHTVSIGTQVWMTENLKTTKYRNGDPIPNITDNVLWNKLTTGAYSNYINDVNYSTKYGKLYNWFCIVDARNIAPIGWHVASDAEWTTLANNLGGESVAGGKLKEAGSNNWTKDNIQGINQIGFTALPGGYRNYDGNFGNIYGYGYWWCNTGNSTTLKNMTLIYNSNNLYKYTNSKLDGFSIRCVKD